MPSVSVIIPNYNRASLIGETLHSILSQTRKPDEIIVVDDGSTDESRQVIRTFAPRVRLIAQENAGPAVARNRGLAESSGDFIQFMDSDDLCAHNKIGEQLLALVRTGADIAYSPYIKCILADGVARLSGPVMQQFPLPLRRSPAQYFAEGWGIYLQACLFRRSTLLKVGPFRTNLMPTEDYEFLFRVLLTKPTIVHVTSTCFVYRLHTEGQISFGSFLSGKRARDYVNYVATVSDHIRAHKSDFRWRDRVYWWVEAVHAERELGRLEGLPKQGHRLPQLVRDLPILLKHAYSLAWQCSRKFHGRVHHSPFGEGPVTHQMIYLMRDLGYKLTEEARLDFLPTRLRLTALKP